MIVPGTAVNTYLAVLYWALARLPSPEPCSLAAVDARPRRLLSLRWRVGAWLRFTPLDWNGDMGPGDAVLARSSVLHRLMVRGRVWWLFLSTA